MKRPTKHFVLIKKLYAVFLNVVWLDIEQQNNQNGMREQISERATQHVGQEKKATGSELLEHMAHDGSRNGSHQFGLKEIEAGKIYLFYHWHQ